MTAPRDLLPGALRAWNVIYAIACGETVAHLRLRALEPANPKTGNEIGVSAYGPDASGLAERLAEDVRSWGRIWELDPVFEVYPNMVDTDLDATGAIFLGKRHSRIRVTWPDTPASTMDSGQREPVVHQMRLLPDYLDLIASGAKTIEIRCDDRKRRAIRTGDRIQFSSEERSLTAVVERISRYATFEALYAHEDHVAINPRLNPAEQLDGLRGLYDERKRALGAVAIHIGRVAEPASDDNWDCSAAGKS